MGSIVKTIGKVIKKIGKALKKIAPILLVAAIAYIGYGYMTGGGGWTQVTDWGNSLMGGVSQGQTLSQAANAAGGMETFADAQTFPIGTQPGTAFEASPFELTGDAIESATGTPYEFEDTGLLGTQDSMGLPTEDVMGLPTEDGMGLPTEGGLLSEIQDSTNIRFNKLMDGFVDQQDSTNMSPTISSYFMDDAQAAASTGGASGSWTGDIGFDGDWTGSTTPASSIVTDGMGFPGGTGTYPGVTTQPPTPTGTLDIGEIPHPKTGSYFMTMMQNAFGNTFGKAWKFYKGLWKDNPFLAMYGTSKIIQLVMAAMDESEEKESYRRRHVMGFAPGDWKTSFEGWGGGVPRDQVAGVWAGEGMRQSSVKPGPKPAGGMRTSAIDRKPQGVIGPKIQRPV